MDKKQFADETEPFISRGQVVADIEVWLDGRKVLSVADTRTLEDPSTGAPINSYVHVVYDVVHACCLAWPAMSKSTH